MISASGAKSAALSYDPLGRLYQTSGGSAGATNFLYDGDELIAEYNPSGALRRRYVHGAGVDDPVLLYEGAGVSPGGASAKHLHSNWQDSIIATANSAGALNPATDINTYDEYGIPGAANTGRFGYTGQAWIPELGMYYYKARVYSPTMGRFLQTDPIGYDGGVNVYAYVGNDPINLNDPSGLCPRTTTCDVTGSYPDSAPVGVKRLNRIDAASITHHAVNGDGSDRAADFTQVSLADLGASVAVEAGKRGSNLNSLILQAARTGNPVAVTVTNLGAGGQMGGGTPLAQQLAIGRFAVNLHGHVTATSSGAYTIEAAVYGVTDRQDYKQDPGRNGVGNALTAYGAWQQARNGGRDFDLRFFGSQTIRATGRVNDVNFRR